MSLIFSSWFFFSDDIIRFAGFGPHFKKTCERGDFVSCTVSWQRRYEGWLQWYEEVHSSAGLTPRQMSQMPEAPRQPLHSVLDSYLAHVAWAEHC